MSIEFDPIQYKITTKANWNTVAHTYHYNWAEKHVGPFQSTKEIVKKAKIKSDDKVLDIACGTGVVLKEIAKYLGKDGLLVGIDLSRTALGIAKKSNDYLNTNLLEMDAENIGIQFKFNKITCQYGLMFFPDTQKVLKSIREILKQNGDMIVAVHGLPSEVPYFSTIMEPILKYIPDIRAKGTPTVHRFGSPEDLKSEISKVGFSNVSVTRHEFTYEPGTFEEYWEDYMHSTANSIRTKIESYGQDTFNRIKQDAKESASKYIDKDQIKFPWVILIASAHKD